MAMTSQPNHSPPAKLECMSAEAIVATLHHPNSRLPPVRPCDTPNASETKSTYTLEELHRLTGCRRFRNYQHIISGKKDGILLNTGEFSLSLGTYATIPKAPRGKAIDRLPAKYLNIVHVDIRAPWSESLSLNNEVNNCTCVCVCRLSPYKLS